MYIEFRLILFLRFVPSRSCEQDCLCCSQLSWRANMEFSYLRVYNRVCMFQKNLKVFAISRICVYLHLTIKTNHIHYIEIITTALQCRLVFCIILQFLLQYHDVLIHSFWTPAKHCFFCCRFLLVFYDITIMEGQFFFDSILRGRYAYSNLNHF